jgi:hypothetical protein
MKLILIIFASPNGKHSLETSPHCNVNIQHRELLSGFVGLQLLGDRVKLLSLAVSSLAG